MHNQYPIAYTDRRQIFVSAQINCDAVIRRARVEDEAKEKKNEIFIYIVCINLQKLAVSIPLILFCAPFLRCMRASLKRNWALLLASVQLVCEHTNRDRLASHIVHLEPWNKNMKIYFARCTNDKSKCNYYCSWSKRKTKKKKTQNSFAARVYDNSYSQFIYCRP